MSIKPWREIAIPHQDVLQGTFQQSEFAADLSRVHQGSASPEYGDPKLFYSRTFITEGMKLLLDSVINRLSGRGETLLSNSRQRSEEERHIRCLPCIIWLVVKHLLANCKG